MNLTAHLYYGFPLIETMDGDAYSDEKYDWLGEDGYHEAEAQAAGLAEPQHRDYKSDDWQAYFVAKRQVVERLPVVIERVGHTEFQYYVLTVPGAHFKKYSLDNTAIEIPDHRWQWDAALSEWCAKYGFAYRTPSWHLAPRYS